MELKGIKILVVDDEIDLREIIMEEFSLSGAIVSIAENGEKAFELLKQNKFDVVFSDVRMIGGNGIELFRNINKDMPDRPKLFICTGFNDLADAEAKLLNVVQVFPKPFKMDNVIKAVAKSVLSNKTA